MWSGSDLSQSNGALLLPACHQGVYARLRRAMEKVGMRGPFHESEALRIVERPPHPRRVLVFLPTCGPLHSPSKTGVDALVASGARCAAIRLTRSSHNGS